MIIKTCYESIVCISYVAKQNNNIWDSEHIEKKNKLNNN